MSGPKIPGDEHTAEVLAYLTICPAAAGAASAIAGPSGRAWTPSASVPIGGANNFNWIGEPCRARVRVGRGDIGVLPRCPSAGTRVPGCSAPSGAVHRQQEELVP